MNVEELFVQYQGLLEEHTKLNDLNLKEAQLKLAGNKHFWAGKCVQHKRDLAILKRTKTKVKNDLVEKIEKDAAVELSKIAIEKRVVQLEEVQNLDKEIEDMENLLLYVEKAEKILQGMSFDIKNLIDLQKLETL